MESEVGDFFARGFGGYPVLKLRGAFGVDVRVALRVEGDDAVWVVQRRVVFHEDDEVGFALEGDEGCAVGEGVRALLVGEEEGLSHSDAGGDVPLGGEGDGAVLRLDFLPNGFFFFVGSGFIAAGDEGGLRFGELGEGGDDAVFAGEVGGVFGGSDDDEVVSHEGCSAGAELILDELDFVGGGVDHEDVGVAVFADFERAAGADGDDAGDALGLLVEVREDGVQQSGVFGGGGGGEPQLPPRKSGGGKEEGEEEGEFHWGGFYTNGGESRVNSERVKAS